MKTSVSLSYFTIYCWLSQAFQNELPILSLTQRDKVHQLITTRPRKNGVVGVIGNKLIHFDP